MRTIDGQHTHVRDHMRDGRCEWRTEWRAVHICLCQFWSYLRN